MCHRGHGVPALVGHGAGLRERKHRPGQLPQKAEGQDSAEHTMAEQAVHSIRRCGGFNRESLAPAGRRHHGAAQGRSR